MSERIPGTKAKNELVRLLHEARAYGDIAKREIRIGDPGTAALFARRAFRKAAEYLALATEQPLLFRDSL